MPPQALAQVRCFFRRAETFHTARLQLRFPDIGQLPFEKRPVAGGTQIGQSRIGQEKQVIRHARAHAAVRYVPVVTAVRVPPVLHVTLRVLVHRCAQELCAYQTVPFLMRRQSEQRKCVLQLVAEAIGARALVQRCARKQPSRNHLIGVKAVQVMVEPRIRRFHADAAGESAPICLRIRKAPLRVFRIGKRRQQAKRRIARGAAADDHRPVYALLLTQWDLCGHTRQQSRARFIAHFAAAVVRLVAGEALRRGL